MDLGKIVDIVDRFWKFNDNQKPTSSWHDKQDCLKAIEDFIGTNKKRCLNCNIDLCSHCKEDFEN